MPKNDATLVKSSQMLRCFVICIYELACIYIFIVVYHKSEDITEFCSWIQKKDAIQLENLSYFMNIATKMRNKKWESRSGHFYQIESSEKSSK